MLIDNPFYGQIPDGERPDVLLCIFPHLSEFLAVDLRNGRSEISLLDTGTVFNDRFFSELESEISRTLREGNRFPFDYLLNLSLRLEEVIRLVAMSTILEWLDVDPDDEGEGPILAVAVVNGRAAETNSGRLAVSLQELLETCPGGGDISSWEGVINRLATEENIAFQELSRQELAEALRDDSLDYFSLWESRN